MTNVYRILEINLGQGTASVNIHPELSDSLGGLAQAIVLSKLYPEASLIFSIGPLTGIFPFCSFGCAYYLLDQQWQSCFWGGSLPSFLRLVGYTALVFTGSADSLKSVVINDQNYQITDFLANDSLGIDYQSSCLVLSSGHYLIDGAITIPSRLGYLLNKIGIGKVSITAGSSLNLDDLEEYEEIFTSLLGKTRLLNTIPGQQKSCFLCPAGCEQSTSIFLHHTSTLGSCLVSCPLAKAIFQDEGLVFACLRVLGYSYTHEQLRKVADFVS